MKSDRFSLFEFSNYKAYIKAVAAQKGARSGFKTNLAKAARCNLAYVSGVLNGEAHLSLEQAERISAFLGHAEDEMRFFLLLLQHDRAGTPSLRSFFQKQLQAMLKERLNVKSRLGMRQSLSETDRTKYYSAWYYAAIHVAISIPGLQTPPDLSDYFSLPLAKVNATLRFLQECGLAVEAGGRYRIGPSVIHLGNEADQILMHHTNWRGQTIARLADEQDHDLHYSAAVTLSSEDVPKIKDHLLEALKSALRKIEVSKEEEVFALSIDFFGLGAKR